MFCNFYQLEKNVRIQKSIQARKCGTNLKVDVSSIEDILPYMRGTADFVIQGTFNNVCYFETEINAVEFDIFF